METVETASLSRSAGGGGNGQGTHFGGACRPDTGYGLRRFTHGKETGWRRGSSWSRWSRWKVLPAPPVRAAVTEAERGVEEAAARKSLAEATFARYQKLYAEQAVTRQEFEGRQMERDVAVHGLARARRALGQSREAARAAGTTAGYTRITAPFSGIVTVKNADVGMTVFPGTPLITVEEEGHYRLEIAAPESLAGKVQPGRCCHGFH